MELLCWPNVGHSGLFFLFYNSLSSVLFSRFLSSCYSPNLWLHFKFLMSGFSFQEPFLVFLMCCENEHLAFHFVAIISSLISLGIFLYLEKSFSSSTLSHPSLSVSFTVTLAAVSHVGDVPQMPRVLWVSTDTLVGCIEAVSGLWWVVFCQHDRIGSFTRGCATIGICPSLLPGWLSLRFPAQGVWPGCWCLLGDVWEKGEGAHMSIVS